MKKFLKSLTVILFYALAIGQNLPNISTQTKGQLPINRLNAPGVAGLCLQTDGLGNVAVQSCSGTISGTVTNFSANNLSPLFVTSVFNPTTTPALSFSLSSFAPHTFFGNNTSVTAIPGAQSIGIADLPGSGAVTINTSFPIGGGGSLALGGSLSLTCASCVTNIPQLPITKTAVASSWINSYDSTTGLFTATRPAYTDLTGLPQLAVTKAAASSNWLRSYDSTTGLFVASQPAYSDISGTPQLAITKTSISSNWINSYNSATGLFTATQPATADLSDFPSQATNSGKFLTTNGTVLSWGSPSGAGTVTSFSSGNLSPLFTTSVATANTTPAQTFALSTAAAHLFFGNNTAITAAPAYEAIGNSDLPGSGGVTLNTTSPITGGGLVTLGNALTLACPSCLTSVTAHNLLSATHGDTTTHAVLRGDLIAGIGVAPTWTAVAKGGTNTYPKWNASGDVVASTLAASGVGSPTTCTNQAVTAFTLNADAAPTSTCTTITNAFTTGTFPATAHNLLSSTHGDTTPGSVVTGDVISGQSSAWARLAGNSTTTPQYLKSLGSGAAATAPSWAQVAYTDLSGVPSTFAPTAHNILSTAHGDTTAAAAVRGDGFFAIGVTPTWQRLAHPATTGGYFKWNGTDIVASSLAASGTGNCGANNFETGSNADAAPTCAQPAFTNLSGSVAAAQMPALTGDITSTAGTVSTTLATVATPGTNTKVTFNAKGLVTSGASAVLASADFVNQGTTTTLLHGNAAGNPSFAGVNLINDASANQGTVNQLLHGNAAGQPSFSAVASADLNLTTTACTNQFVSAISSGGVGTCTTDTLASAQHANQGTVNTVLHGNAAGNPAFSAVTSADTTGTFPATAHNLLSATHGDSTTGTVARGDIITGQGASPTWTRLAKGAANQLLSMDATGTDIIWAAPSGGTGTVTSFSSGNLSPIFTTSVATATTTPAQTFSLSTAGAHTFLGNNTGATAAPAYVQPAFTDISGVGSCAQEPALTGDVTSSGCAATIASNAVTQSKVTGGYVDLTNAQNPIAGNKTFSGNVSALSFQFTRRMVDQEAGADFGAKLNNCIVNITNGLNGAFGGICDASNLQGFQAAAATITVNHDLVTILLPCNVVLTLAGSPGLSWTNTNGAMLGCSQQNTIITTSSATADVISLSSLATKNHFSDFTVQSAVTRTAGSGIRVSGGDNDFERIAVLPTWNGVSLDTATSSGGNIFRSVRFGGGGSGGAWNCQTKTGGVATGNVASNSFVQGVWDSNGGASVADALICIQDGTDSLDIIGGQAVANLGGGTDAIPVHFELVNAGNAPSNIRITGLTMEGGVTKPAMKIDSVFGMECTACTFQSSLQGLLANSGTRIKINGGLFFNNQQEGVRDNNTAVTDLQILGARFCNNGLGTTNTFSDFFAVAAATGFFVQNNRFLACQAGGNAPKNNVEIASGASTNYQVTNNGFANATGAPILDGGTGTDKVICGNTPDATGVNSFCNVRKIYLTGNYTNATTSLTNVSSGNTLAFAVGANKDYALTCELFYQAASTGGLQIGFTGPASPTAINYSVMMATNVTASNYGSTTAFGNKIPATGVAVGAATTNFPAHIALMLRNGANAGTVTLQAASVASATLTINNTSFCTIQ